MARPKKELQDKMEQKIEILCTLQQRKSIDFAASKLNIKVSELVRIAALEYCKTHAPSPMFGEPNFSENYEDDPEDFGSDDFDYDEIVYPKTLEQLAQSGDIDDQILYLQTLKEQRDEDYLQDYLSHRSTK